MELLVACDYLVDKNQEEKLKESKGKEHDLRSFLSIFVAILRKFIFSLHTNMEGNPCST